MPAKDDAPLNRAELKEALAEVADRIIKRFDDLQSQVTDLQSQMSGLRNRLEKVEAGLVALQKQQQRLENEVGVLRTEIVALGDRLKHIEAGLERVVLTMFKFETRDDIRTEQIAQMLNDQQKLNGRLITIQSEAAEFKTQYSPERVQSEVEEVRRTTRRLEDRIAALERNRLSAAAA